MLPSALKPFLFLSLSIGHVIVSKVAPPKKEIIYIDIYRYTHMHVCVCVFTKNWRVLTCHI